MATVLSQYFRRVPSFLTPSECDTLRNTLRDYETELIRRRENLELLPNGYTPTGLTATHDSCNLFNIPTYKHILHEKLFTLEEFKEIPYLIIQAWGNILRESKILDTHIHENEDQSEHFYNINISLSTFNETYYRNKGYFLQSEGDLTIFASDLEHKTLPKNDNEERYSTAMDIYTDYAEFYRRLEYTSHRYHILSNPLI